MSDTDRRTLWQWVDGTINLVPLWLDRRNKNSRWLTYSWVRSWFGVTALRADYPWFTSRRYAKNVNEVKDEGFMPNHCDELTAEYHHQCLVEAGFGEK